MQRLHAQTTYGSLIALVCSCLVLIPTAAGLAQSPAMPQQGSQQADMTYTDEELVAFARAYAEVGKVRESMETKMAEAESVEEKKTLVKEADAQMIEIVKQKGLSVKDFTQILKAVRNNEQVRNKVTGYIQDMQ